MTLNKLHEIIERYHPHWEITVVENDQLIELKGVRRVIDWRVQNVQRSAITSWMRFDERYVFSVLVDFERKLASATPA
jgi:hypothetical protein